MKAIATVFCVLLCILMLSACKQHQHANEIKQIDSLLMIHQETASSLGKIDSVHAKASRATFSEHWEGIREVIEANPDVEEVKSDPWWSYATLYEANDRGVKKLLKRYMRLVEQHQVNEDQLTAFRKSVKKNQIPSDSIPIYMMSEQNAVSNVYKETMVVVPELMRTLEVLDSLHAFAAEAAAHYRGILSVKAN